MVEAIANGIEDKLIDGLSFKLSPGASYVTDRRSLTYHPQGSNNHTPGAGTKLIRLLLTSDNWLECSTFRIMFDVRNTESTSVKKLRCLGSPWSFFRRMRILAGGQVFEDVDSYNRVHEMTRVMTAGESRVNDFGEGFGLTSTGLRGHNATLELPSVEVNQSQTVLFKPLSGLFNQGKFLPIRYCPITLELELVGSVCDPIVSAFGDTEGPEELVLSSASLTWQIENVQVKVDLCALGNALDNSYASRLLSGKSLPINYNTFVSQFQAISGQAAQLNVSRALTKLKSVFVSLDKDKDATEWWRKVWNDFSSPTRPETDNSTQNAKHNANGEFEFHAQIGGKLFPEYPIRSHAEAFYQLKKRLGVQASTLRNFDIAGHDYRENKFVIGIDCERVLHAGFTGISTKAGDLLVINFK
jgi:hypothetical protein